MIEKRRWEAFSGKCLEEIGFPISGKALIDYDAEPRLFDVVLCTNAAGVAYLKEVIDTGNSKLGRRPMVHTRYKDREKNFAFWPVEIIGVVLEARDKAGNLAWKRPQPADYAEVVRCIKCRWHDNAFHVCSKSGLCVNHDSFCSDGEKDTNAE